MSVDTFVDLVRLGALCGWYVICVLAGLSAFAFVVLSPFMVVHRFLSAPSRPATDWLVAALSAAAVLALYWVVRGGNVPHF